MPHNTAVQLVRDGSHDTVVTLCIHTYGKHHIMLHNTAVELVRDSSHDAVVTLHHSTVTWRPNTACPHQHFARGGAHTIFACTRSFTRRVHDVVSSFPRSVPASSVSMFVCVCVCVYIYIYIYIYIRTHTCVLAHAHAHT
jgi:hypothetical protein